MSDRLSEIEQRLTRNAVPDPHPESHDCRECSDARDIAALVKFAREVEAANDRYMEGTVGGVSLSVDIHAAVQELKGLDALGDDS